MRFATRICDDGVCDQSEQKRRDHGSRNFIVQEKISAIDGVSFAPSLIRQESEIMKEKAREDIDLDAEINFGLTTTRMKKFSEIP